MLTCVDTYREVRGCYQLSSLIAFHLIFRQGLSLNLELSVFAGVTGQGISGICLSSPPYSQVLQFILSSEPICEHGYWVTWIHACTARTLPSQSSLQFPASLTNLEQLAFDLVNLLFCVCVARFSPLFHSCLLIHFLFITFFWGLNFLSLNSYFQINLFKAITFPLMLL